MPLDYSKWDKLELSDDSDIEVHPNVDKRSFIKWKQESIHMEREQRRQKIEFLQNETGRNARLLEQLNSLITACEKDGTRKVIEDITEIRNKARKEGSSDTPIPNQAGATASFDSIMESLLAQIEAALKTQSEEDVKRQLVERLRDSRAKAQARQDEMLADLAKEQKEASKKLTSENMFHESYNKTMINKSEPSTSKQASKDPKKKTTTVIETLNPDSVKAAELQDFSATSATAADAGEEDEDEDDINVSPLAKEFAKLSGFEASFRFIGKHPEIVSETYSDQLLAEAFTEQLVGNEKYARNCVYQSLILQYCGQLGKDGISLFFARMNPNAPNPQPRRLFEDDVNKTYTRIKNRCAEINAEKQEQQVETIQLQQMQEGSKLTVRIPNEENEEEKQAAEVYNALPPKFRTALETGELEEINKVLADMKVEDAELVLKVASDYGFLDVEGEVLEEAPQQPMS